MAIHTCELCGSDFLTEADPYVVRPDPTGVKLYCVCQIRGFEEMKGTEKLREENEKLKEENKKLKDAYEKLLAGLSHK